MHDARGRELKAGDRILIPAIVTKTHPGEDFCNVEAETFHGRRPDGAKENFYAFNTAVTLRANDGDENASPFG